MEAQPAGAAPGPTTTSLQVATTGLPDGQQGDAYSTTLQSSGAVGATSWSLASGTLPSGLSLSSNGQITGVPSQDGSSFTVKVTDSDQPTPQTASKSLAISVQASAKLAITSSPTVTATQGKRIDVNLSATGGTAPYTWSVGSGTLPTGLTLDQSGYLTGTPTDSGTESFSLEVADATTPTPQTAQLEIAVSIAAAPTLAVSSTTAPAAYVGEPYSTYLTSSGGAGATTWTKTSGSLPDGITFDSTGLISGTPTAPGSESFTVTVTDSATPSPDVATQSITIKVGPAQLISISTSLPGTYAGEYYDGELEASGGTAPYTWSITTGSLPPGLTLDASTGVVTGDTTQGGTYDLTVGVKDSSDPPSTGSIAVSIDVQRPAPLEVTSTSLVEAVAGTYYGSQLSSSGGYGYSGDDTWSVTSGTLPPGIDLNSDGYLEGYPTGSGTYAFTVAVTDGASPNPDVATTNLVLVVAAPQPLTVNPTSLPAGAVATYYDKSLTATGGIAPYTWAVAEGDLPPGLTLEENGVLYGTPSAAGSFTFTVTLTDSTVPTPEEITVPLTIVIEAVQPLAITTPTLPSWAPGTYYDQQLTSSGGTGDYTWSITGGSLPQGVSLYDDGYLYGEPQASGSFTFTVEVADDASPMPDTATQTYTVDFPQPSPITITTTSLDGVTLGEDRGLSLDATGGDGNYTWSVSSGALPDGMTLESDGYLYGEPTDPGTSAFTVEVTDDETPTPDIATETYTVDLPPPPPITITSPTTINLTLGEDSGEYLGAIGGDGNYTWSVSSGALPDGMTLDTYGYLYGTPTTPGTSAVTVTVTDDVTPIGDVASRSFTIVVPTAAELAVTSAPLSGLSLGTYSEEALTSTGGYGSDTWSISSGALPQGLYLESDGYLYGTPSEFGTFTFTLLVTDSNTPTPDVATQIETVTVPPPPPIELTAPTLPTAQAGQNFGIEPPSFRRVRRP